MGIAAGYVMIPFNASDPEQGTTGQAIAIGRPGVHRSAKEELWFGLGSEGHMRVSAESWVQVYADSSDNDQGNTNFQQMVAGTPRFPPMIIGDDNQTPLGYTRHLRRNDGEESPLSVRPSQETDQAWMFVSYSGDTSMIMLWDKTVTP